MNAAPDTPGWYWHRGHPNGPWVVGYVYRPAPTAIAYANPWGAYATLPDGEWVGPIPAPPGRGVDEYETTPNGD